MSAAVFPVCVFLVPVGTRELNHVLSTYLLGAKEEEFAILCPWQYLS